ncbi:Murein hydrolase activator NlpD [hydrothermal vent metagenome]|uniref:Murein hydrolase activator NlpD n=1 Tax=hydrothermal vent metagenome TaxID=652676 RepID=A0A3B0ZJ15_9ZZZZ
MYTPNSIACLLFYLCVVGAQGCGHHLYHRAETGETLYSISWQYGYDYKEVAKWNELQAPYRIKRGQIVRLVPPELKKTRTLFSRAPVQEVTKVQSDSQFAPVKDIKPSQVKPSSHRSREIKQAESDKRITLIKTRTVNTNNWRWPVEGKVVSKYGSKKDQLDGVYIAGRLGASVKAAAAGRVVYSGNGLKGYGNLIIVKHNQEYLSAYAYNKDIYVSEGDVVKGGQKIAELGQIDDELNGLYFEIRKDGEPMDPLRLLP